MLLSNYRGGSCFILFMLTFIFPPCVTLFAQHLGFPEYFNPCLLKEDQKQNKVSMRRLGPIPNGWTRAYLLVLLNKG